jgi:chemotaxis protein CheD
MGIINFKRQAPHVPARVSGVGPSPLPGERQRVYLLPGQFHVSAEPCQIKTILGSCVSICLWDSRRATGGMNHYLLPSSREDEPVSLRFGDVATSALLEKLLWIGCRMENLTAKVFGGAAIFQNQNRYAVSLGARNVAAALLLLQNAGIPVVAQQIGGSHGRKLIFNTDDGAAWTKRV